MARYALRSTLSWSILHASGPFFNIFVSSKRIALSIPLSHAAASKVPSVEPNSHMPFWS